MAINFTLEQAERIRRETPAWLVGLELKVPFPLGDTEAARYADELGGALQSAGVRAETAAGVGPTRPPEGVSILCKDEKNARARELLRILRAVGINAGEVEAPELRLGEIDIIVGTNPARSEGK